MIRTIGFVGVGTMGAPMSEHLLDAGYEMNVFNRTKEKALPLLEKGARWCDSAAQVAQSSDLVFSMVGYPSEVEEVYYGQEGLFKTPIKGKYFVDLTTSSPTLARKIFQDAKNHEASVLDAPVIGNQYSAKQAALTIVVGGEKATFTLIQPLLKLMAGQVIFEGEAGAGQHYKLARQVMLAGMMMGIFESFAYAEKAGLNLTSVIETAKDAQVDSCGLMTDVLKVFDHDETSDFSMEYFMKDLEIVLDESKHLNAQVPGTELIDQLYEQLKKEGLEAKSPQAFMKLWWE